MAVNILRRGSRGPAVERWQMFLIGRGHLRSGIDGDFGPRTEDATKAFQRNNGLTADGIAGPASLGLAMTLGFDIGFRDPDRGESEALLPEPGTLRPISTLAQRQTLFGAFDFEPDPSESNRERIKVLGNWEKENIKTVTIPELVGKSVFGKPSSGRMRFHRLAVDQLTAMWAAWAAAGLSDRVLTYEGSYNARFIRGSRETLSNHAFGSAFDINATWNGLGAVPASTGAEGSVRELVAIANEHGFYWGGHFKKRPDGMHFEVAKLL